MTTITLSSQNTSIVSSTTNDMSSEYSLEYICDSKNIDKKTTKICNKLIKIINENNILGIECFLSEENEKKYKYTLNIKINENKKITLNLNKNKNKQVNRKINPKCLDNLIGVKKKKEKEENNSKINKWQNDIPIISENLEDNDNFLNSDKIIDANFSKNTTTFNTSENIVNNYVLQNDKKLNIDEDILEEPKIDEKILYITIHKKKL